ncbi:MAG: aminotransferase class V-fold PLP-dependent enzyme [Cyclobacteriaceae bacterium]
MEELRGQFPILSKYTYLNTARYCALPRSVVDIQKQFLDHVNTDGSWNFDFWSTQYESTRKASAQIISCPVDKLFFLPNVSLGFNLAAQYLPKRKVICLKGDFPSVNLTWEPHGFEVKYLDYQSKDFENRFLEALSEPEQIVSVSWIQSEDGFEMDLDLIFKICKEKNHFLILDGTQGLGAIPFQIDLEVNCLFLASGFKWLLAGYGIAMAYASNSILKYLKPMRGWNSGFLPDGNIIDGAKSLEVGNATYLNVSGLGEALKLINQIGIENIEKHNHSLKAYLKSALAETQRSTKEYETRSSILSFSANETDYQKLVESNIQITKQAGFIRVAPHFYNNVDDIKKMLDIIA